MSDAEILNLCREWRGLFDTPRPDTDEAAADVCRRLVSIEEELARMVPETIGAAVAMMGVVLTYEEDLGSGEWDLAVLRAVAGGLERLSSTPPAA